MFSVKKTCLNISSRNSPCPLPFDSSLAWPRQKSSVGQNLWDRAGEGEPRGYDENGDEELCKERFGGIEA